MNRAAEGHPPPSRHEVRAPRSLRPRGVRQSLVAITAGALLGSVGLFWIGMHLPGALLAMIAMGFGWAVRRSIRGTSEASDQDLDERLIAVRDAAYRTSYTILTTGAVLAFLAFSAAANSEWIAFEVEARHLRALFWAFLGFTLLLPGAVLALREEQV